MKKYIHIWIAAIAFFFCSCDGMNENVNKYLEQGETIYIAKSDSAFAYAGKERFVLRFWISDPRATKMRVTSNFMSDDVIIDIPQDHDSKDSIECSIPCAEGSINMKLITSDIHGNTSIPDEYMVNVYGDEYLATVLPKYIRSSVYNSSSNKVTITWGGVSSVREYGVKLLYTDLAGQDVEMELLTDELRTPTVIEDMDIAIPLYYQTITLPETDCVDLIYTESTEIKLAM